MKRIKIVFFMTFILTAVLTKNCFAISARSAIVIDAASRRVLYSHNAESRMGMASTTKIMTAITALENADLSSVITVSPSASGVEGSSMYLAVGEKLTLENALYGLMLVSGNDAATAIAEHISGSTDKFAQLMNKKALEIGVLNTNFTNPHGLSDDNHYTTAHDLALITAYGMQNNEFLKIVSTKTKKIPWKDHDYDRVLVNHNKFMSMYEGCIGVKTGFTKATGRCLVTAVEKNGMRLICVTLNAPDDWNDHKTLYDKVFSEYTLYRLKQKNDKMTCANIKNGVSETVDLICNEDLYIPIKENEDRNIDISAESYDDLQAPVYKGDVIGMIKVKVNGELCCEFPLSAANNVEVKKATFPTEKNTSLSFFIKVLYMWLTSVV